MRTGNWAILLAVILGTGACDEHAPGPFFDTPPPVVTMPDGGVEPDLSRPWQPPPGQQKGEPVITAKSAPLGKIVEGGRYELSFLVDTVTTYDDVYRFSLSAIDVTGSSISEWNAGSVLSPAESWIDIGKPLLVKATFTVPVGARVAKLVFSTHSLGGLRGNAFPQQIVVGEVADISDPRMTADISDGSLIPDVRNTVMIIDGTEVAGLQFPFGLSGGGVSARLSVDATAPGAAGDFRFSAEIEGTPGDWVMTWTPDHFNGIPAGKSLPLAVELANKSPTGKPTISYLVVRAAHLPSPGATTPDYRSWGRVPIQGYMP